MMTLRDAVCAAAVPANTKRDQKCFYGHVSDPVTGVVWPVTVLPLACDERMLVVHVHAIPFAGAGPSAPIVIAAVVGLMSSIHMTSPAERISVVAAVVPLARTIGGSAAVATAFVHVWVKMMALPANFVIVQAVPSPCDAVMVAPGVCVSKSSCCAFASAVTVCAGIATANAKHRRKVFIR